MMCSSGNTLPCTIHPSAWKRNSANFAFTEFSEVGRFALVTF